MIVGTVSPDGVPVITLEVGGKQWAAIVDTGFNGDLELPAALQSALPARFIGRVGSLLAAGQQIEEDVYLIEFLFDGQSVHAEATFVAGDGILIGTHLLRSHRLEIDFPQGTVKLQQGE